ncbi:MULTISPECIES: PLP-dependent aminotransferase family protein [unclassified Burkholderia]|uniref:aminotransferase-like domain-containing protein n=1 Tax=unclassified Burkholderia TaxID=2613784 RepID=UPI000F57C760|nr:MULTISPECIES: PLP-dependent aminotransferase family protein [unclassified Burkholderia]RQR80878.1 PLP-dependent aminotransferase family protein [Burkholderia sp. Bp9011]RQR88627.1 PLP-dependent aminotransferase family protein [Burkholderia sp. Bp9010]RQS03961.1 PLP-dependent aminotransferase family protein [Burkholderia sp. Bp8991]RQS74108.1 PLP-dependent aminotransferase family protein [Burkholderia sp. Bp8977]
MSKSEYLKLADAIAADIADGTLRPGDRLPPQRNFADQRKIAVSTASRVYAELLRRGLAVGEVGRGTFVSGDARRGAAAPSEPRDVRIDLEFNYPILPDQATLIARSLSGLERATELASALSQATSSGTPALRNVAAACLTRDGWAPSPEQLVFTGNGRQSIAAAVGAIVPTGGRCGVESLTYPFIKGIAVRLGITLVPLAMDEGGVRPDAILKAHREANLSAIYIQPAIQNPLGMTMNAARREDLLRVAEKLGIPIIEDNVYGFLDDEPPLAALSPENCVVIDSLSKKVAPGLTLGFVVAPRRLRETVMASVRSGGWTASGFAFAATQRLMSDGTVAELARLKRLDAVARQKLAADRLSDFDIQTNGKCFHLWLKLPAHWRSQALVAAAARRGIALTPSTTFAASPGHAPNAVRLALAAPTMGQLDAGLLTLSGILNSREEDFASTE